MIFELTAEQLRFANRISLILNCSPDHYSAAAMMWDAPGMDVTYAPHDSYLGYQGQFTELQVLAIQGAAMRAKVEIEEIIEE
jgi:hypothetical protein